MAVNLGLLDRPAPRDIDYRVDGARPALTVSVSEPVSTSAADDD